MAISSIRIKIKFSNMEKIDKNLNICEKNAQHSNIFFATKNAIKMY